MSTMNLSPARAHRARVLAAQAAASSPAGGEVLGDAYELMLAQLIEHRRQLKTIQSPYGDGEVYLAMPALKLDVALLHVNYADRLGNTLIRSADPMFDDLFARAADHCIV